MHRRRLLDHPAGNLVNTGDARLLAFASNSKRRRKSSTLVGKHVPDSEFVILAEAGIQRGRVAPTTPKHLQRPGLIFIPRCAGAYRHGRLVRKHAPDSDPGSIPAPAGDANHRRPNNDCRGSQEKCRAGAGPQLGVGWGAQMTPEPFHQPMHPIFMPWCAGGGRHERLVRKHVPDSDPGSIPAPAGDTNHRRPNNHSRGSQEKCSAGACP